MFTDLWMGHAIAGADPDEVDKARCEFALQRC